MAVAHDAATESTYTTTSPHTFTHTPVGTPRGVVLKLAVNANENPSNGVVFYGGVAMVPAITQLDSSGESGDVEIYFLGKNIPPGPQTVSIGHSGSATTKWAVCSTVTANRNTEVVVTGTDVNDQANPSIALESGTRSALRYGVLFSGHDSLGSIALGASMSAIHNHDFGSQVATADRQTTASTGSFTIQYTATSEDVAYAGIAVAELTGANFDTNVTLSIEAAFGYTPFDSPGWFDITDRCRGFSFRRGRDHELDTIQAGSATFIFDNQDGELNANNTASDWYPNVKPMVPIRIVGEYNGTAYPLWYGFVEGWPVSFPGQVDSIVEVNAVDLFKLLSLADTPDYQSQAVLALTPDAYWRFSGAGTSDSTGNGHGLTFAGSPTTGAAGAWTDDEAVTFDGSNDEATVGAETVLEYVDVDMTVSAWVKPATTAASGETIIGSSTSGGNDSWRLGYNEDTTSFFFGPYDAGGNLYPFGSCPVGSWYHVAVTKDEAATITFYINGEVVGTATDGYTAGANTRTVRIGRYEVSSTFFTGSISEIALWGRVLSAGEISAIYTASREQFAEERTDERIANLLTLMGFTSQDLEQGQSDVQAEDPDGTALDEITKAVDTEGGLFFIAGDGTARFQDRHWRTIDQATSIDTFDDASNLPYTDIVLSYDDAHIWNEVQVDPGTGEPVTAVDTTSQDSYGRRTLSLTTYPANENEAADRAQWTLGLYAEPATRIETLTLTPQGDTDLWPILLGAELSNRYTVSKTLAGDDFSQDVYLEAISMDVRPKFWSVTLQLSPASSQSFWLLGEAGFGELGETTVLGF